MSISLVDAGDEAGNLSEITAQLTKDAATLVTAEDAVTQGSPANAATDANEDEELPVRFRGKSRKEIAEMYANLESSHGRMANDLGQQRILTDRLLDLKRATDLAANGGGPVTKPKITRDEILADDPTAAIDKLIDARLRPLVETIDEKLNRVVSATTESTFTAKHPDFQQIANDPAFGKWIGDSPVRVRAAMQAKAGDLAAADDLLTEWKRNKVQKKPKEEVQHEVDLEGARNASTESGGQAAEAGRPKPGKVYRRADLIKLRMDDPERYYSDEFQSVIMKAYSENRVK